MPMTPPDTSISFEILKQAHDCVIWTYSDGRVRFANDSACRQLRYSAAEFECLTIFDLDDTVERANWPAIWDRLRADGGSHFQTSLHCGDGGKCLVECFDQFMCVSGGEIVCTFFRDISEQSRREQVAAEKSAQFAAIFDNSPSSAYFKNLSFEIVAANANFRALHGELNEKGMPWRACDYLSPEEAARAERHDRQVFAEARVVEQRHEQRDPDGRKRTILATKFPVYDEDGEIIGVGGINTDLTEAVERERAILDARAEAEAAAAAAERAAREAERANESKSVFLANMSHEIRTPLNGLLGAADLLSRTGLNERQRQYVDIFQESGKALLDLLNGILDISKIEAGKLELESEVLSVSELVHASDALWSQAAETKGLRLITTNAFGDRDYIRTDHVRLRQIINNLLGNALKFTAEGEVALRVGRDVLGAGGTALTIEVRDTGIGISRAERAHLFEPFSQADSSTTRRFGGTGLGLTICKRIVGLMGGAITVESAPERGSTFRIVIPVEIVDPPSIPVGREDRAAGPHALGEAAATLRVLVAEDNKINRELFSFMLQPLGCRVEFVENGEEAVAAVRQRTFDLVLMDIQMPVMDGLTAAKEIRALDGERGRVPIVAVTANAMPGDRERFLAGRMSDYVSKPLQQADLFDVIARNTGVAIQRPAEIEPPSSPSDAGRAEKDAALGELLGALDKMLPKQAG